MQNNFVHANAYIHPSPYQQHVVGIEDFCGQKMYRVQVNIPDELRLPGESSVHTKLISSSELLKSPEIKR